VLGSGLKGGFKYMNRYKETAKGCLWKRFWYRELWW